MTDSVETCIHGRFDHFMIGCQDLSRLTRRFSQLSGVDVEPGGRHPALGTHNALSRLDGSGVYLEFIAPDSQATAVDDSALRDELATMALPTLCRLIMACDAADLDVAARFYASIGWGAPVRDLSRQAADGSELRWRLLIPNCPAEDALFAPYLIDWGSTAHPTTRLAGSGLRLLDVEAGHPDAERLRSAWGRIGILWPVARCARAYLRVRLETPLGVVSLNSG